MDDMDRDQTYSKADLARWWKYGLALLAAWLAGITVGIAAALGTVDYSEFPADAFGGIPDSIMRSQMLGKTALLATLLTAVGWIYVDYVHARDNDIEWVPSVGDDD